MVDHESQCHSCDEQEEFGELLKYTGAGFAGGLITGAVLDHFGFHQSALGQWLVRTLSGEGESLFEGIYAIRQRIRGSAGSMAEAYGWGKLSGMVFRGSSIGEAEWPALMSTEWKGFTFRSFTR